MANDTAAPTVPVTTLAKLFSLTDVRVQQLAKMGVVVKAAHGKYDLWASIKGYVTYLQERAFGKKDDDIGAGAGDLQKERIRLTKAKADQEEIQAALLKGKVHDAEVIREIWSDMIGNAKAKINAIPVKAAGDVRDLVARHASAEAAEKIDLPAVREVIADGCREALQELSDYQPDRIVAQFVARHQPAMGSAPEDGDESMGGRAPEAE